MRRWLHYGGGGGGSKNRCRFEIYKQVGSESRILHYKICAQLAKLSLNLSKKIIQISLFPRFFDPIDMRSVKNH